MTKKSKTLALLGTLAVAAASFLLLDSMYGLTGGFGRVVDGLIAQNVAARGGADKWRSVDALRISGHMDLGQGMHVPYTIEQKRPGQMCLEFEFNSQMATQCVTAEGGWKVLPFMGRTRPERMTEAEYAEMADAAAIDIQQSADGPTPGEHYGRPGRSCFSRVGVSIWSLSAHQQFAARYAAAKSSGHVVRRRQSCLGFKVYVQHQSSNELLSYRCRQLAGVH